MVKQFFKSLVIRALTLEARLVLAKYKPRIVAITGTVGKTTTKDAIYSALAEFFYVRKSEKSFNSEIGVPLTILGLRNPWNNPFRWFSVLLKGLFLSVLSVKDKARPPGLRPSEVGRGLKIKDCRYPEWLVLEVGADRPGDIARIAKWLCPDVAVITRFAEVPVHIEFFPSPEALVEEKAELARAVPEGGTIVLGCDDEKVRGMLGGARGRRTVSYGVSDAAEVRGSHYEVRYESRALRMVPVGISFRMDARRGSFPATISGALGAHLMQPVLAAFAVCTALNLNLVRVAEAMRSFVPPPGRMRLLAGVNESLIIDDTYNSSPAALFEALEALRTLAPPAGRGRKIAVLGDMMELGKYTVEEHRKAGRHASAVCDLLLTVGVRGRVFAEGAQGGGMRAESIFSFENSREAGRALKEMLRTGDTVLVKGSQAPRMERVVLEILAAPARGAELLVRQEREWLKRG